MALFIPTLRGDSKKDEQPHSVLYLLLDLQIPLSTKNVRRIVSSLIEFGSPLYLAPWMFSTGSSIAIYNCDSRKNVFCHRRSDVMNISPGKLP